MTIDFTLKDNKKPITVKGYGTFYIRPYGAGEELQIRANLRRLDEIGDAINLMTKSHNADDKVSEEDAKQLKKFENEIFELSEENQKIVKGTISCDDKKAIERLFNERSNSEIREIISTALGEGN